MTPLHQVGYFVRELLMTIPLPVARVMFLAVPTLVLVWVLTLPNSATAPAQGQISWSGNLKLVAAVALLLQIVAYSLL